MQRTSTVDTYLLSCFYEGISQPQRLVQGLQRLAVLLGCERVSLRLWDRRGHWGYAAQAQHDGGQWLLDTDEGDPPDPKLRALVGKFEPGEWQRLERLHSANAVQGGKVAAARRAAGFLPAGEVIFSARLPLPQAEALLSLHRQGDDWPDQRSRLAQATDACHLLRPALEPIVRLRQLSRQCDHLTALLNGIRLPMLLLDTALRPLAANSSAAALFRLSARMPSGKMAVTLPGVPASQLAQLVERACAARPCGGALGFSSQSGKSAAYLLAFPVTLPSAPGSPPAALLVVQDDDDAPDQAQQLLQHVYRLTPAEARLAQLILDGRSPGHVAAALQVSLSTIRTQLSAVLKKTGAQRQADLVRRLSPLVFLNTAGDSR